MKILLVEDDDGDARAVKRALEKSVVGNTITRAIDGIEAMEILKGANGRKFLPPPHIILLDLNMPRMNGIEFLTALREDAALRPTLVFVLTTSKRDEDRMAAYDLNVAGYVTKARAAEDFLTLVNLFGIYDQIVEFP